MQFPDSSLFNFPDEKLPSHAEEDASTKNALCPQQGTLSLERARP